MPRADDLPSFTVDHTVTPCTHNPLGVKGCGEAGAIGSPPAFINALTDALGVKDIADAGHRRTRLARRQQDRLTGGAHTMYSLRLPTSRRSRRGRCARPTGATPATWPAARPWCRR